MGGVTNTTGLINPGGWLQRGLIFPIPLRLNSWIKRTHWEKTDRSRRLSSRTEQSDHIRIFYQIKSNAM